ncbi:acyl carrier protein, partial [Jatrophihabitans sp.]|uniref:acyl carrier protein n=1 Tax=Jatrophihabitans sp. TaxID=1932789 RepID=UPI002EEE9089
QAPTEGTGTSEFGTLRDELARIWAELFDVADDFQDDQNLFEVGGTSLTAVRLRARIVSEFGVDIPLGDIYAGGSIAELLPIIEAGLLAADGSTVLSTTSTG